LAKAGSDGEREMFVPCRVDSPDSQFRDRPEFPSLAPSDGERVRVRGSGNCISLDISPGESSNCGLCPSLCRPLCPSVFRSPPPWRCFCVTFPSQQLPPSGRGGPSLQPDPDLTLTRFISTKCATKWPEEGPKWNLSGLKLSKLPSRAKACGYDPVFWLPG
jgi:hypothetical protein